jgi:(1->4)-alpha-D-glucan 1-alpha-D-glucosylmutase
MSGEWSTNGEPAGSAQHSSNPFLAAAGKFAQHVAFFGRLNSLAQVVLKLTSPGVPDLYQGNEAWDLSLVDPDNRRPVDFAGRRKMLDGLRSILDSDPPDLARQVADLLAHSIDGRIKMYLTAKTLRYRRQQQELFSRAAYAPVSPVGSRASAVCAYLWKHETSQIAVTACIRPATVSAGREVPPLGTEAWADTFLPLPEAKPGAAWRNVLTGETLVAQECGGSVGLWLKEVFAVLPVAVVEMKS